MATVPVTRTWVAGEVVTAAFMNNNISAVLGWLLAPAICQVRQIVSQSIPNNSDTDMTFTAEDVDTTGMHSTTVNTNRLTVVYPGWYMLTASSCTTGSATGRRGGQYALNGTNQLAADTRIGAFNAGTLNIPFTSMLLYAGVGDYFTARAFQDSGGALNTVVSGGGQSRFSVVWTSN